MNFSIEYDFFLLLGMLVAYFICFDRVFFFLKEMEKIEKKISHGFFVLCPYIVICTSTDDNQDYRPKKPTLNLFNLVCK